MDVEVDVLVDVDVVDVVEGTIVIVLVVVIKFNVLFILHTPVEVIVRIVAALSTVISTPANNCACVTEEGEAIPTSGVTVRGSLNPLPKLVYNIVTIIIFKILTCGICSTVTINIYCY